MNEESVKNIFIERILSNYIRKGSSTCNCGFCVASRVYLKKMGRSHVTAEDKQRIKDETKGKKRNG